MPERVRRVCVAAMCAVSVVMVSLLAVGCRRGSPELEELSPEQENRYDAEIRRQASAQGLPPELLKAVIWKESRFRAEQIGSKGELGLMQLMGPAIEDWARTLRRPVPSRRELMRPALNIEVGAWYLGWCGRRFPAHREASGLVLQLAIYNAGFGRARQWLPKDPTQVLTIEDISFPTTRDYIRQILTRMSYYRERGDF